MPRKMPMKIERTQVVALSDAAVHFIGNPVDHLVKSVTMGTYEDFDIISVTGYHSRAEVVNNNGLRVHQFSKKAIEDEDLALALAFMKIAWDRVLIPCAGSPTAICQQISKRLGIRASVGASENEIELGMYVVRHLPESQTFESRLTNSSEFQPCLLEEELPSSRGIETQFCCGIAVSLIIKERLRRWREIQGGTGGHIEVEPSLRSAFSGHSMAKSMEDLC